MLGLGFYQADSSFIFKWSLLHIGGYELFHKVDQSCSFEEYDAQKGN
jgi:hypothetical protein